MVRSQIKVDLMGNLIGLDFAAVQSVIELYQIAVENQRHVFNQVVKCFYWAQDMAKQNKPEGT